MRISPSSLSPAEACAPANAQAQDETRPDASPDEVPDSKTSPAAIDAGRAQRLLERAASLATSGDLNAAILATRQALALAPGNVEGHLLHAGLLERNRDFGGARAAYAKSVETAPGRADARANLARLDAYLEKSQGAARQFHFDDSELFGAASATTADEQNNATAGVAPIAPALVSATPPPAQVADATAMLDQSMLPDLEVRLPPSRNAVPVAATSAASGVATPQAQAAPVEIANDRRKHNVPVAVERRRAPAQTVTAPLVPRVATPPAAPLAPSSAQPFGVPDVRGATSHVPLALDVPPAPVAPLWQQIVARPSFYARTLPLIGVALLSLGFLNWARARAVSRVAAPASTALASANTPAEPSAATPGVAASQPGAPANSGPSPDSGALSNADAGGFPISNAPAAPAARTNGNARANAAGTRANSGGPARPGAAPARANTRDSNRNTARPTRVLPPARAVPNFPGVSLAPAPIPPASVRNAGPRAETNQNSGGSTVVLPSPNIELPAPSAPRQRVLPPGDSALNPAGSPARGYVRVTEGRVGTGVIPSQPSAVARDNERAANDAARNGQSDQAISQLSQAIRADSEGAGFRYQQRATLFLQRGDYNRAADDFQSAIAAYQNQIANGEDVVQARRGLRSARSGLNLALAGRRD